ncbi:MAG: hypothetical protein NZ529_05990 [Cytophagaceae bacterium]|nr:hypothetical protein [Cytophagaceae bacterium]MDW8456329.1 hypothetical protein [Cytophagaceae bacterium]
MNIEKKIQDIVLSCLEGSSCYLIDVQVSGKSVINKITVTIDNDHGISIDECGDISQKISKAMDEVNITDHPYVLEVTSPGAEEPIKTPRQYIKNKGRRIRIISDEDETITGKIEEVKENSLILKVDHLRKKHIESLIEIEFSKIKKSNIIISFN